MKTTKKYLTIRRVAYGANETPKEVREYRMFPKGGPVGTISDWSSYAKDSEFDGLKIIEKDGSINHKEI